MIGNYLYLPAVGATGIILMIIGLVLLFISAIVEVDHDRRRFDCRFSLAGAKKLTDHELKAQVDTLHSGVFALLSGSLMLVIASLLNG